jgi:hypothetical protein
MDVVDGWVDGRDGVDGVDGQDWWMDGWLGKAYFIVFNANLSSNRSDIIMRHNLLGLPTLFIAR